jgi:hypothetical protein
VDVEVHHGLAGGGADVHADVVAVGMELFVEEGLCLPDEGEEGGELRVGRVEEGGDVPEGDFFNGLIVSELSHSVVPRRAVLRPAPPGVPVRRIYHARANARPIANPRCLPR